MKRILYLLGYTTFALILPLIVLNYYFPFVEVFDKPKLFQVGFFGFIAILIIFAFFRKNISKWVKSFSQITLLKGFVMWVFYIMPAFIALVLVVITAMYSELFVNIFSWTFVSHTIAGIFNVYREKEAVIRFKKWVNK